MSAPARKYLIEVTPQLQALVALRDGLLEVEAELGPERQEFFDADVTVPADVWNRLVALAMGAKG